MVSKSFLLVLGARAVRKKGIKKVRSGMEMESGFLGAWSLSRSYSKGRPERIQSPVEEHAPANKNPLTGRALVVTFLTFPGIRWLLTFLSNNQPPFNPGKEGI